MSSEQPLQNSNIRYVSPIDYAQRQGAPLAEFQKHGYDNKFTMHQGRVAWRFKTHSGYRYRFMDGDPLKNKYTSEKGFKTCWFGLTEALEISEETNRPLIMVNGEAGVIVSQYHGLPAFCLSGGELTKITVTQMSELTSQYTGKIIIALDCDNAGRNGAQTRRNQFKTAKFDVQVLDLQLGDKGDIADFCKLYGSNAYTALLALPEIAPIVQRELRPIVSHSNTDSKWSEFVETEIIPRLDQLGIKRGHKHGTCISPNHDDHNPSARIGEKGVYICTCGSHSMKVVAEWLGLDFKTWLQDKYPLKSITTSPRIHHKSVPPTSQNPQNTRKLVNRISDDLPPHEIAKHRTLLIEGGTGLGKSHAVGQYANSLPASQKITCAAQLRTLVSGLKQYIDDADHYEDTNWQYQHLLSASVRLLTSISSLHKFDRTNSDLLIIDEIAGVIKFIVTSSTFRGSEAVTTYQALKKVVTSAKQIIGMDANLSETETKWINDLRGNDAVVKKYSRKGKAKPIILLKNKTTAIWQTKKMLEHKKGQVYVACSSERTATEISDLFSGGTYKIFKITRDTSSTEAFARFLAYPTFRNEFDLVIYDPAMLAGVDISEPVYALIGIIDRLPLAPEDAIQLMGRVRNAQRYYANVPPFNEGYKTPTAQEIKADRIRHEYWTAKHTGQTPATDQDYLEMLDLWSQYEERRQRETAQWRTYFIQRLQRNGFKVKSHDVIASKELGIALRHWRDSRKQWDWEFVLEAEGLAIDDTQLEKIRANHQEITHELRLRNIRYKIEAVLGHDEVNQKDKDLMLLQKRKSLQKAVLRKNDYSLIFDKAESVDGIPLQKRHYYYAEAIALKNLFTIVEFDNEPQPDEALLRYFEQERSTAELDNRFANICSDDVTKLLKKLGHQTENANTVIGRVKWLVNYLWGVKPQSVRHGRGKARYTAYILDTLQIDYLIERRERAAKAYQLKEKIPCTTNLSINPINRSVVQTPSATVVAVQPSPSLLKPTLYNDRLPRNANTIGIAQSS